MLLIVDDHPDTRQLLVRVLTKCGYDATAVTCGREALLFLKAGKPRLVILDFSMPDMDGLTVFKEMRRDPRLSDVPVIMFSAHDGRIRDDALQAGVEGYFVKGAFEWADLKAAIARLAGPASTSDPVEIARH